MLVHKNECQFITFEGLTTTFEASTYVSFDTDLFIFVTAIHLLVTIHTVWLQIFMRQYFREFR